MASFFDSRGRTRAVGLFAWLAVALGVFVFGTLVLRDGGWERLVPVGAVWGAMVAKLRVEMVRRLHDQGHYGWFVGGMGLAAAVALIAAAWLWLARGPDGVVLTLASALLAAAAIVLFRPAGPAAAGHEPAGSDAREIAIAAVLIGAGAAVGYAVAAWSSAARLAHERAAERAEHYVPPPDPFANQADAR